MDVSILLTMTQTVLQLLDSSILKEIQSVLGFRSQLMKIKETMSTIKDVLVDAEKQEKLQVQRSEADLNWLKKLKDVLYQADDLFDEVATLAAQQEKFMDGNKVAKKVRIFLSHPTFACNMSREIKKIREKLDEMAKDRRDFGSSLSSQHHAVTADWSIMRSLENHSFVYDEDVIGRDQDKKAIIDMLLDPNVNEENVSSISIVGMGGLGKTTLAQLVYNDERVTTEFPLRLWVCVSHEFDMKTVVRGILESATKQKPEDLSMDLLQGTLRQHINGKKYLLVLDDLWSEDRGTWLKLRDLLIGGGKGSKILVTTRSKIVGKIIGNDPIYSLNGLAQEDSWLLFEKMAFGEKPKQRDAELVEIGTDIVRKCGSVPLAIRVIGSLLYGQGKSRWLSFKNDELANIRFDDQNSIINILKLSYYQLSSPLKSCFSYCAIFPKNYSIDRDILISLWLAQGFILPSESENAEEIGNEYLTTLVERCFFQDVTQEVNGEIISCKMHDLMHDVAKEAAGSDIMGTDCFTSHLDGKTRHLTLNGGCNINSGSCDLDEMKRIRTIFKPYDSSSINCTLLQNARRLRVVHLTNSHVKSLQPIDKFLHLRYLDLSFNRSLKMLPTSITMLLNLQTLRLTACEKLKELPRDLSKLTFLRCLDIERCDSLTHMPPRMNKLTRLHRLPLFVVGTACYGFSLKKVPAGQIEELEVLTNLQGKLEIKVRNLSKYNEKKGKKAQCIQNREHLKIIKIEWGTEVDNGNYGDGDVEALLEGLQPHHNLTSFSLCRYPGMRFPIWTLLVRSVAPQSNLVEIHLLDCKRLRELPSLSRLPYLKTLKLQNLGELEYVESSNIDNHGGTTGESMLVAEEHSSFFPSLEKLIVVELPKLKGWWRLSSSLSAPSQSELQIEQGRKEVTNNHNNGHNSDKKPVLVNDENQKHPAQEQQESVVLTLSSCSYLMFPRLSHLEISGCPNLTSIPCCPNMRKLTLLRFSEALKLTTSVSKETTTVDASSSTSDSSSDQKLPILKRVIIDNVGYLKSLPVQCFEQLSYMEILGCEMESLSMVDVVEVFERRLSSLSSLTVGNCKNLKSLTKALEHLTALENLSFQDLPELILNNNAANDDDMTLNQSLHSLRIGTLPKLVELPKGMQTLTALQSLSIRNCQSLQALPAWISCLSSLKSLQIVTCPQLDSLPDSMRNLTSLSLLEIQGCSESLVKRCQAPDGEDWLKIQHIPHFTIYLFLLQKMVLRVDVRDRNDRHKAMKIVSTFPGVMSISLDAKSNTLAVIGDEDPVQLVMKLRKAFRTEVVSIGSAIQPMLQD